MTDEKFNPLAGWTKEQIKSTLKAHTKTDLLKIAMQWKMIADLYLNELKEHNKSKDDGQTEENREDIGLPEQAQDMGSDSE